MIQLQQSQIPDCLETSKDPGNAAKLLTSLSTMYQPKKPQAGRYNSGIQRRDYQPTWSNLRCNSEGRTAPPPFQNYYLQCKKRFWPLSCRGSGGLRSQMANCRNCWSLSSGRNSVIGVFEGAMLGNSYFYLKIMIFQSLSLKKWGRTRRDSDTRYHELTWARHDLQPFRECHILSIVITSGYSLQLMRGSITWYQSAQSHAWP